MTSKAWKELNKRADNLYPALTGLENMPTDELRALQAVCTRVTGTNCSWVAFLLAPILEREITGEFRRRAARREHDRKARRSKSVPQRGADGND